MGKKVEMIGKRFGRWTVLEETLKRSSSGTVYYLCKCDCGKIKSVHGTLLRNGQSKSCGCYNHEIITKDNPKYKRKLYSVHASMLDRCRNSNNKSYHNYGGRGIKVADEWIDYDAFETWSIDHGYKQGLWLDRINNDGDYSPDNCRWTTPKVQQNNKRPNVFITINGQKKSISQWSEQSGIKVSTIKRRIDLGWSNEKLLSPVNSKFSHGESIKASLKKRRKKHDR